MISPAWPCFRGHFPDDPILPGVVQLKMIADLITQSEPADIRFSGVSRIKFRRIVRPSEQLDIEVVCESPRTQYGFKITCGTENVCSGKMYFLPQKSM